MCIADLAMTAGAVAPPGHDNDVVGLLKPARFRDDPADLVHDPSDFVTQRDRRRDVGIFPEVSVHELHVGAAHSARRNLDEDLIGLNVRNRHVLKDEGLAIFVHACGFHVCVLSCIGCVKWSVLTSTVGIGQSVVSECRDGFTVAGLTLLYSKALLLTKGGSAAPLLGWSNCSIYCALRSLPSWPERYHLDGCVGRPSAAIAASATAMSCSTVPALAPTAPTMLPSNTTGMPPPKMTTLPALLA